MFIKIYLEKPTTISLFVDFILLIASHIVQLEDSNNKQKLSQIDKISSNGKHSEKNWASVFSYFQVAQILFRSFFLQMKRFFYQHIYLFSATKKFSTSVIFRFSFVVLTKFKTFLLIDLFSLFRYFHWRFRRFFHISFKS